MCKTMHWPEQNSTQLKKPLSSRTAASHIISIKTYWSVRSSPIVFCLLPLIMRMQLHWATEPFACSARLLLPTKSPNRTDEVLRLLCMKADKTTGRDGRSSKLEDACVMKWSKNCIFYFVLANLYVNFNIFFKIWCVIHKYFLPLHKS